MSRAASGGYSLVELVVVMTLIGVIAGIAIPRYTALVERARIATLQGDLHQLRLVQELHHRETGGYASSLEELGDAFRSSPEVSVEIVEVSPDDYAARAVHDASGHGCLSPARGQAVRCGRVSGDMGDGLVEEVPNPKDDGILGSP